MQFSEKVVLVAGGTGGLGRVVSLAFLKEGADVIVTWRRDEAELAALKTAAAAHISRFDPQRVDVTDKVAVAQLIERILAQKERLDAVVNTIGGYSGGTKMWESEPEELDKMLALNLRSGFLLSRAAAKAMLTRGRGAIVNVAAKAALSHTAGLAAYAASKAAAVAMIDSLAADLEGTGVRANSLLPSIIDTEANRKAMPTADFAKWTKPEDIAKVILFLCSDDANVIHGASIPVS
jgi:NAD(P)-dependent dehydrogenase (short-subunit alcohol dehydrogenase family)